VLEYGCAGWEVHVLFALVGRSGVTHSGGCRRAVKGKTTAGNSDPRTKPREGEQKRGEGGSRKRAASV